jgi:hypothetical protein
MEPNVHTTHFISDLWVKESASSRCEFREIFVLQLRIFTNIILSLNKDKNGLIS